MVAVKISGVEKSFGSVKVLRGIDIDIDDGQFVVLVGSSGCGKSTLLRLIAGLDEVSSGDIIIDDVIVNDALPSERDIAMVFQSYALYPHMTVRENMAFALKILKLPKPEIERRIQDAARILSMGDLLDRFPKELSGGQRQRVAMGRSLVRNPKVFLFDEPLSNLDAKLRVRMRAEIKSLHQRLRTTAIYVTHDQIEAMTMGDMIVLMNDGRIEQKGPPLELYDRPISRYVAEFIGSPSMNIMRGTIIARDDACFLEVADSRIIPIPAVHSSLVGQVVDFGIRPEHLKPGMSGLDVELQLVEPMGSETQISVKFGQYELVCMMRERIDLEPGAKLRLEVDADNIHLFSVENGARIN